MNISEISYDDVVQRNIGVLTNSEQEQLKNKSVAYIGLDQQDVGAVYLAKMGFKEVVTVHEDNDDIKLSDMNNSFLATVDTLGKSRNSAANEVILKHNPFVIHTPHTVDGSVDQTQAESIVKDIDFVVITTKNMFLRLLFVRAAQELRKPYTISDEIGSKISVMTFQPGEESYEQWLNLPSINKELTEEVVTSLKIHHAEFYRKCGGFSESCSSEDLFSKAFPAIAQFAAGVSAGEVAKLALGKEGVFNAPIGFAFDLFEARKWDVNAVAQAM